MRRSFFVVLSGVCALSFGVAREARAEGEGESRQVPVSTSHPATVEPAGALEPRESVAVELRANDGRATMERRKGTQTLSGLGLADLGIGGVTEWEPVCVAPCAAKLSPRDTYRIAGDGLVPSATFALPRASHLRLDADLGSSRARVSGVLVTLAGAGAMALGTGALVASPFLAEGDVGSQGFRTGVLAGGVGSLALGTVLVAVGVTLWATNGTSLRFDPTATTTTARPTRLLPNGIAF